MDKQTLPEELLETGLESGKVTLDQVNEYISEDDVERIDAIFDALEARGIAVDFQERPAYEEDLPADAYVSLDELRALEGPPLESSFEVWKQIVGRVPVLTAEREAALARAARAGSADAKFALIEANLRLVMAIAKRYSSQGVALQDLVQEGNLGLMRAADKYDERKGYRFAAYASWWIRHAVTRALSSSMRAIRLPQSVATLLKDVSTARAELQGQLLREPTQEEIARHVGIPASQIQEALSLGAQTVSIDAPVSGDEGSSLADFLEDFDAVAGDEAATQAELRKRARDVLASLPEQQRALVELRYGFLDGVPRTLEEVGDALGLAAERVAELERSALDLLRASKEDLTI
jgi:RNA polymerase primary sigma factor